MTRGDSPQGASPNAKSIAFWGYFSVRSHDRFIWHTSRQNLHCTQPQQIDYEYHRLTTSQSKTISQTHCTCPTAKWAFDSSHVYVTHLAISSHSRLYMTVTLDWLQKTDWLVWLPINQKHLHHTRIHSRVQIHALPVLPTPRLSHHSRLSLLPLYTQQCCITYCYF